jgi:hypothetical protein
MPFGLKNGPPTYQRAITKAFREYLDNFMKIFLDDITVYSDMESHLQNLRLCFQKCKGSSIILNLEKCAFMVFFGMILGFIVSKERKLPNLKKLQVIVNMSPCLSIEWDGTILQMFYQKNYYYHGTYH